VKQCIVAVLMAVLLAVVIAPAGTGAFTSPLESPMTLVHRCMADCPDSDHRLLEQCDCQCEIQYLGHTISDFCTYEIDPRPATIACPRAGMWQTDAWMGQYPLWTDGTRYCVVVE